MLTESDAFLREEGPFVTFPPSLLEDLLQEVYVFLSLYFPLPLYLSLYMSLSTYALVLVIVFISVSIFVSVTFPLSFLEDLLQNVFDNPPIFPKCQMA